MVNRSTPMPSSTYVSSEVLGDMIDIDEDTNIILTIDINTFLVIDSCAN
jgi:hypothetical protein